MVLFSVFAISVTFESVVFVCRTSLFVVSGIFVVGVEALVVVIVVVGFVVGSVVTVIAIDGFVVCVVVVGCVVFREVDDAVVIGPLVVLMTVGLPVVVVKLSYVLSVLVTSVFVRLSATFRDDIEGVDMLSVMLNVLSELLSADPEDGMKKIGNGGFKAVVTSADDAGREFVALVAGSTSIACVFPMNKRQASSGIIIYK